MGTVTVLRASQFVCILSSDDRLATLHVLPTGGDPADLRVAITEWWG